MMRSVHSFTALAACSLTPAFARKKSEPLEYRNAPMPAAGAVSVALFLLLSVGYPAYSQTAAQDLARALTGKTIVPSADIAFAGDSSSGAYQNDKPGKCPVKTILYNDGTEDFITEKFGLREIKLTTHKSFPHATQFTMDKAELHSLYVQLHLVSANAGDQDACVRLMFSEQRLEEPTDQLVEDVLDRLVKGKARPRDGGSDIQVDMNVLALTGPGIMTKGDATIELVPDTGPGIPRLVNKFEPAHPGFKEQMLLPCGGYSSSRQYWTKSSVPHPYTVPGRDVADGGFVVKITNKSSHSINGDSVLLTSRINGNGASIVNYFDMTSALSNEFPGSSPSGSYFPTATKVLGGTFYPDDTSGRRAYVRLPGESDLVGHVKNAVGTTVDIIIADMPTKFDPAGNPTQRDTFVFHLKVENKHDTVRFKVPNAYTVCEKD